MSENFSLDRASAAWGQAIAEESETNPDVETRQTRRGRPKGSSRVSSSESGASSSDRSEDFESEIPSLSPDEVRPLVKALANTGCRLSGVSDLTETEVSEISEAGAPVLEKYFGAAVSRYAPEIVFLGVVFKVASPRVAEYNANKKAETETADIPGVEVRDQFGSDGGNVADS